MARFASMICALLAWLPVFATAKSLAQVLKSFDGKSQVDCGDVCKAKGMKYRGYSMYWSGGEISYTCKCHKGSSSHELVINCEMSGSGLKSCCEAGTDCSATPDASPQEEEMAEVADEVPESFDDVVEDASNIEEADEEAPDCPVCSGAQYQLTKAEITHSLTLHNKMRKAVGTPPLKWSCDLMCQVQDHADKCAYSHSDSHNSKISAGENLASGADGELAAWMWFSEYGAAPEDEHASYTTSGHFTAMVWKSSKDLGCGVCRKAGSEVFLCQYANSPANYGGSSAFEKNVPIFKGTTKQYEDAGLDAEKAKEMFQKFNSWGLDVGTALSRFYGVGSGDVIAPLSARPSAAALAAAGAAAAIACAAVASVAMRLGRAAPSDPRGLSLVKRDAAGAVGDEEELAGAPASVE